MKINLKEAFLLDRYEKTLDFKLRAEEDEILSSVADFPGDPAVRFTITGKYGLVRCDSVIDLTYRSYCCRCLAPVTGTLHIEGSRRVITDPQKEDEDTVLLDGGFWFNPEEEAKNQIILEFPERFLCSDDCKGLCPVCGCNRNTESCGCETDD